MRFRRVGIVMASLALALGTVISTPAAQCNVELQNDFGDGLTSFEVGLLMTPERRGKYWHSPYRDSRPASILRFRDKEYVGDWLDWNSLYVHNPCNTDAWFSVALHFRVNGQPPPFNGLTYYNTDKANTVQTDDSNIDLTIFSYGEFQLKPQSTTKLCGSRKENCLAFLVPPEDLASNFARQRWLNESPGPIVMEFIGITCTNSSPNSCIPVPSAAESEIVMRVNKEIFRRRHPNSNLY